MTALDSVRATRVGVGIMNHLAEVPDKGGEGLVAQQRRCPGSIPSAPVQSPKRSNP